MMLAGRFYCLHHMQFTWQAFSYTLRTKAVEYAENVQLTALALRFDLSGERLK